MEHRPLPTRFTRHHGRPHGSPPPHRTHLQMAAARRVRRFRPVHEVLERHHHGTRERVASHGPRAL